MNDPGFQYPQGPEFQEGTRTGDAWRIAFQNIQFLRNKAGLSVPASKISVNKEDGPLLRLFTGCRLKPEMALPKMLLLFGEETYILPPNGKRESYFIFNMGKGKNQINGTINGVTAGYTLTAQYKYVEIQDAGEWIVVRSG